MSEIFNDDMIIQLLNRDGSEDSTVHAPFLRKGRVTFTQNPTLVTRIADCFKLEENFIITQGEDEESVLERSGSTLVEHGTSFLTLHIDKDGNLFTYYLGKGSLDTHYLEGNSAETLLDLVKLYFSIPVRNSENGNLRKVLIIEGYRNFAPRGSELESQLEGFLKEHSIYALV